MKREKMPRDLQEYLENYIEQYFLENDLAITSISVGALRIQPEKGAFIEGGTITVEDGWQFVKENKEKFMKKIEKKKSKKVLTIEDEVRIGDIILEKGDKIKVLNERMDPSDVPYDEVIILVGDRSGQYIPQEFAETYKNSIINFRDISKDDWNCILEGPSRDNEWYWEAWNNIEQTARLKIRGKEYVLYQNGDLFAVPADWPEEYWEAWAE